MIAIIFVISVHYNSKGSLDTSGSYGWNYIIQEFWINGIARVAVPFFALISGFFLVDKLSSPEGYISILKNKTKTLLVPYVVASATIFIVVMILNVIFKPENSQAVSIYSLFYNILAHPISPQFWFLRDMIFLVILSPILLGLKKPLNYFFIIILGTLWFLDIQLFPIVGGWYLVNIETIFFFCVGGMISRQTSLLLSVVDASLVIKLVTFFIWLILIGLRIYIDPDLNIWYVKDYSIESLLLYKLALVVGTISLIQLSAFYAKNRSIIYISGLTFFAYLFHFIPLSYFRSITEKIIMKPFSFYLDFPIAVILVFLAAHLVSKYFPNVYAFVTGGRNPNKALKRIS